MKRILAFFILFTLSTVSVLAQQPGQPQQVQPMPGQPQQVQPMPGQPQQAQPMPGQPQQAQPMMPGQQRQFGPGRQQFLNQRGQGG